MWFKVSKIHFVTQLVSVLFSYLWLRANQGISQLKLCSFIAFSWLKESPLWMLTHIVTERLILAPRLLLQQKRETVNVVFYLFLVTD